MMGFFRKRALKGEITDREAARQRINEMVQILIRDAAASGAGSEAYYKLRNCADQLQAQLPLFNNNLLDFAETRDALLPKLIAAERALERFSQKRTSG